jgi:hypothetical protein
VPLVFNAPEVKPVYAAAASVVDPTDVKRFKLGLREVNYLLDHWEEKTEYCNFGEFQRELLLPENKEKLKAAAAKGALWDYDKSETMNIMCKKDPQVVRGFLGLTQDNLVLNRADSLMRKPATLDLLADEETVDEYFEAVDKFTLAVSEVDTLSYNARTDFASTETAKKGESESTGTDYLAQSKVSVTKARDALATVVRLLAL